ncbi:MAG TPA: DUF11 domain-containing protein [Thermoguttaceae bacterium]|nr:DUF11 domain-containing protein [Thermoguttaceae bacterium]
MKRLIVRISALGTVVALGLIAIAQAQRGTEDTPPVVERPPVVEAATPSRETVEPIIVPANSRFVPATGYSGNSGTNPLRAVDWPTATPLDLRPPASSLDGPAMPPPAAAFAGDQSPGEAMPLNPFAKETTEFPMTTRYPDSPGSSLPPREPALLKADASALPTGTLPPWAAPMNDFPAASSPIASSPSTSSPSTLPGASAADEGSGQPGSKQIEGPQSPHLTIEKVAPKEIQVGKVATFGIKVRNTGAVSAAGVEIRDVIPRGTRLISTVPQASRGIQGELVWTLGTLQPGAEASVEIKLMPIAEGEIGSVATVAFQADASARTVATKPELVLQTSAPQQVLIGEELTLSITVSNPGSGVATGVVLEEHIPPGLQHPAGAELEYRVGDLPPGESRRLELTLLASRPGPTANLLTARGEGNLRTEDRLDINVVAPGLDLAVDGPRRRYLEREATYQFSVHNPGTASAEGVELVAYLPRGLKFVRANNSGYYEETERAVYWRLEELPVNETGTVELVAMPVESGEHNLRLRSSADRGVTAESEQPVLIEGIAAIMFEAVDVTDPIEVGGETTYEIRVLNQGSKAATNVQVAVILPVELRAISAEGPAAHVIEAGRVLFEPLPRLAPKADTTYRVRVQGLRAGDLRARVQVWTDEMTAPVTKEESTRVYSDQ